MIYAGLCCCYALYSVFSLGIQKERYCIDNRRRILLRIDRLLGFAIIRSVCRLEDIRNTGVRRKKSYEPSLYTDTISKTYKYALLIELKGGISFSTGYPSRSYGENRRLVRRLALHLGVGNKMSGPELETSEGIKQSPFLTRIYDFNYIFPDIDLYNCIGGEIFWVQSICPFLATAMLVWLLQQ